jgi:hypothetical protein
MRKKAQKGFVRGAELCSPLRGVHILRKNARGEAVEQCTSDEQGRWKLQAFEEGDVVKFYREGFSGKVYNRGPLPRVVRLLEDRTIGYQKRLWYKPGQRVEVFVHSLAPYSARLFRHGLQKDLVADVGRFGEHCQQVPDGFFVENGLNWDCSFEYVIPEKADPGIYSVLLEDEGGKAFAIPMVVSTRNERRGMNAKILVLGSTNTWQSYNIWGGRSRYRDFERLSRRKSGEATAIRHPLKSRLSKMISLKTKNYLRSILKEWLKTEAYCYRKLTILRPYTNCSLEGDSALVPFTNHLAAAEWRVLAWLERENIPYDFASGAELHSDPQMLRDYRAVVLCSHCEYWTREMYEGLRSFHEKNSLWILNLSGNSIYREIIFYADGSTRCVSLSFAHSCSDESKLLGVRFTEDDLGTCAPYEILEPRHWAFDGVRPVEKGKVFAENCLNRNTPTTYTDYDAGRPFGANGLKGVGGSGWETDKLTKTAPKDITIIAKGLNKSGGADMVVREPSSERGGMFSASSITFGGCLLVDDVASSIVKNVIARALST